MTRIEIRPAAAGDVRRVLRNTLAMPGQTLAELESQVTLFLQYAREMALDPTQSWWCIREGHELCACTCVTSPGRTAMILLPAGPVHMAEEHSLCEMVNHVVAAASQDVCLVQCLVAPTDEKNSSALCRAGFMPVAELIYMERGHDAAGLLSVGAVDRSAWQWTSYSPENHADFCHLIAATYVGSRDCPRLTGLRDMEDIMEGHKAAGRFAPHRWRMLLCKGEPMGCILLAENPLRPVMEISYMGVHPAYRGRGLGRVILAEGLEIAHRERITRVTLAVDCKNEPAVNVYQTNGFRETMRRVALVRSCSPNHASA